MLTPLRSSWPAPRCAAAAWLLAAALALHLPAAALAQAGDDDDDDTPAQTYPNVYLDLRSSYSRVPAGVMAIGFSTPAIAALSHLTAVPALRAASRSTATLPASQGVALDVPLTIDLNDRVSIYGGFTAGSSQVGDFGWAPLAIWSWNVGIQADIYQQNGGPLPTITLQSTLTRALPDGPLATTSLNTVIEAGYAFDKDETRGLLAGMQLTGTAIDAGLAAVQPILIGYLGGYYQWDNNWKFSGRAGIQRFGGAELLRFSPVEAFTQPILRLDIDKMDGNDNRLFGVTAQIAWTPKPAYQLIVRTPLYLTRN